MIDLVPLSTSKTSRSTEIVLFSTFLDSVGILATVCVVVHIICRHTQPLFHFCFFFYGRDMHFCLDGMAWDGNITGFFLLLYMYTTVTTMMTKIATKPIALYLTCVAHHNNHKHNVIILLFLTV